MISSSGDRGEPVPSPGIDTPGRVIDEPAKHTLRALAAVREELAQLEKSLCSGHHPLSEPTARLTHTAAQGTARSREAPQRVHVPAWLRRTQGESRWPVAARAVNIFK